MHGVAISLAVLGLAGCASTPLDVGSEQHPQADLTGYRSFVWISEDPLIRPSRDASPVSPLTARLIREAIERELSSKGFNRVADGSSADFVVAFTVGARDRIDADSYPEPYRGNWLWRWEGRYVDLRTYREGTLSIDVFDGKSRQPVWHGWARKTITQADSSDPDPVIRRAVARILEKFPAAAQ